MNVKLHLDVKMLYVTAWEIDKASSRDHSVRKNVRGRSSLSFTMDVEGRIK